jgi:hypothetical protein
MPSAMLMKDHAARIERLSALAERLGRLTAEAHNLVDDLTAKLPIRRAAMRSTDPRKRRPSHAKNAEER